MAHLFRSFFALLLSIFLVACGQQEDTPPEQPAEVDRQQPVRSTPADPPVESATSPTPDEADSPETSEVALAREERNRLREQYQAMRDSWDIEVFADQFDLSETQKTQLQTARDSLVAERVAVRNRLRSIRDLQRQAQEAGNESDIDALTTDAAQAQERLAAAERRWKTALSEILTNDQLAEIPGLN